MLSSRPGFRRAVLLSAIVALIGALTAVPIAAADTSVTGSMGYLEKIALSPQAVAIVTIVDTAAAPDAGAVIGQQRIDAPAGQPIPFSVPIDAESVDPSHAYALFATIVDGANTWENRFGLPVITGGPSTGIELVLTKVASSPASITGSIAPPAGVQLGPEAVKIAALINVGTGRLAARQVVPVADPADLSFSIGFDPALIDPTATYVVKGGLIDGAAVWQNRAGVTAIDKGVATGPITVPVTAAPTGLPVASPAPTAKPTAKPTVAPTSKPTTKPTASPAATATPTATPTPTPTPTATPAPTATPTAAPTATPTAAPTTTPTAAPSNAPSPTPVAAVSGTLTYREPYQLTGEAFAAVALVRGSARATESSIVVSHIDRDISTLPVPFKLDLGGVSIDPSVTYTIQATIVDGENAWVTAKGIPVLTQGNPTEVAITLAYRPDVLKGVVSGQITAVGLQPSATAYSMAVLVDPASGESLGIDVKTVTDGLPVAFAVPYAITDINQNKDYVVTAEIGDGEVSWRNVAGVPVITKGNPTAGVQVVVTEVLAPTPSPSLAPPPTPGPTPIPLPEPDKNGNGGLLTIIILIAVGGALAAFFIARGRNSTDTPTPPAGTEPAAGPAAADAPETESPPPADAPSTESPPQADAPSTAPPPPTDPATANTEPPPAGPPADATRLP